MNGLKISLIIPVFNAELYLRDTVRSVLALGLEESEYEILLINDGSTDTSQQICYELQDLHSNIRCFSQKNKGVCAARNLGIREALGQYIGFVDADDLLVVGGFKYLFENFAIENYDVIRFWTRLVYSKNKSSESPVGEITFEGEGWSFIEKYGLDTFCVGSIYCKEWLVERNISFEQGLTMGEDFLFCSQVLLNNPRILSTSCNIYNYIIRERSATTNRNFLHIRKSIESQLVSIEKVCCLLKVFGLQYENAVAYKKSIEYIQKRLSHIFSRLLLSDYSLKEFILVRHRLVDNSLLPLQRGANKIVSKTAIFINLLYYCPFLYPIIKVLYSRFFIPYIYPRINRNG